MATPKVFIPSIKTRFDPITETRIPLHDLTPAAEFGDLQVMLPNFDGHGLSIYDRIELIGERLTEIHPRDCIVSIGDPLLIAAAIHYSQERLGSARVLVWDFKTSTYKSHRITL